MNSKINSFLTMAFLASLLVLVPQRYTTVQAQATTIKVPQDYSTIQEAINHANGGDTIQVSNGTYHEAVVINKTLTLIGMDENCVIENRAVNGDPKNHSEQWMPGIEATGIDVLANNCTVEGFIVRNCTVGIRLSQSNYSTIARNNLTLNIHAALLDNSNQSIINNNSVESNLLDGIELNNSYDNTVSKNIVSFTSAVDLDGEIGFGVHLSSSSSNRLLDNFITYSASDDIFLEQESNNNTWSHNTIGPMFIYSAWGSQPTIDEGSCANNTFFLNNILSIVPSFTPYPVWSLSSNDSWSFQGLGNYWADYSGLDDGNNSRTKGDGIGDNDLPWHGVDNYPLISPINPFPVLWDNQAYFVTLDSNSTICSGAGKGYGFRQSSRSFEFIALGPENSSGYFNLTIPKTLLSGPWDLYLSGSPDFHLDVAFENETHTMISKIYRNDVYVNLIAAYVIPEYNNLGMVLLMVLLASLSIIGIKRAQNMCRPILL